MISVLFGQMLFCFINTQKSSLSECRARVCLSNTDLSLKIKAPHPECLLRGFDKTPELERYSIMP